MLPLLVEEEGTSIARDWVREDPQIVTWGLTGLEIVSAIERRTREGAVTRKERRILLQRFAELMGTCSEVVDLMAVRRRASPLLARHKLRAADAAHVGAALLVADGDPASLTAVCLDRGLAAVMEDEGFDVLTWAG